jgi:branched-chain amino acid aminotransferase
MPIYYVDGEYLPDNQARLPVDDLAILRGIGVFDLMNTRRGKPLFIKEHISRLCDSARKVNLTIPWSAEQIQRIVENTVAKNDLDEASIRVVITGGSSPDFITPAGRPRLIVLVTPPPKMPRGWYEKGVKVISVRAERRLPGAKSIDYLPAALALGQAKARNAVEAIYLDRDDRALEGTTSNLFIFSGDILLSPARNILSGITRSVVLELARRDFRVELRDISYSDMIAAREVFITGTSRGVVPVIQVDDTQIGDGRPGPNTRKIMSALEEYVETVVGSD